MSDKTTRLGLYLPDSSDTDWGTLIRENFEKIDQEFQDISTELTGGATTSITNALKGTTASFSARFSATVNAAGASNDYDRARYSRIGAASNTIVERLGAIETILLATRQNPTTLSSAPDEILGLLDDRVLSNYDMTFSDLGQINRWYCSANPALQLQATLGPGPEPDLVVTGDIIYAVLGRRAYKIPAGKLLMSNVADGDYYIALQSWAPNPIPAGYRVKEIGKKMSSETGYTVGILGTTVTFPTPADSGLIPAVGDIVYIRLPGSTPYSYYRIKTVNSVHPPGDTSIAIEGRFEDALWAAGEEVVIDCHSVDCPRYIVLYPNTVPVLQLSMTPGTVVISSVSVAGGVGTFVDATENSVMSRYHWIDGTAWNDADPLDLVKELTFAIGLGCVKNIFPIVRTTAGEVIFVSSWGTSWMPATGKVYVRRPDSTFVCFSSATGAHVHHGDVSSWGVMIEI